ncbi:MAG: MaoC family dehydratase [Kiloniellales bacterium]
MTQAATMTGHTIDDISVGMTEVFEKSVSEQDIAAFADVSGDYNPVHMDQAYAETTMFKGRIAHGMLSAAYISTVLGTRLPGPGCIYLSQSLKFRAPVRIGDTVVAKVEVTAVDKERRRVTFATSCKVGDTVVVDGEAQLMVPAGSGG